MIIQHELKDNEVHPAGVGSPSAPFHAFRIVVCHLSLCGHSPRQPRMAALAAKKLVVKLKQRQGHAPATQQTEDRPVLIEQLRSAVRSINSHTPCALELEELFTAVCTAVAAGQAASMLSLLSEECQSKAAAEVAGLAASVALDATSFLQHVVRLWEEYSSQLGLIRYTVVARKAMCVLQAMLQRAPLIHTATCNPRARPRAHPPTLPALPACPPAGRCSCTWTVHLWSTTPARSACFSWACCSCACS